MIKFIITKLVTFPSFKKTYLWSVPGVNKKNEGHILIIRWQPHLTAGELQDLTNTVFLISKL